MAAPRSPRVLLESLVGQQPPRQMNDHLPGGRGSGQGRAWGGRAAGHQMDVLGAQPEEEIRPRWGEGRPRTQAVPHHVWGQTGDQKRRRWNGTRAVESTINQEWQTQQTGRGGQALSSFHKSERERNAVRCQLYADSEIRHTRSSL